MKKIIYLAAVIFFLSGIMLFGQVASFPVENGSFEKWEVPTGLDSTMMEPVDWSSIKTSDNTNLNGVAPVIWKKSVEAHSGEYSVFLHNVSVFNIVATGTLTNGRVHSDMDPDKGYVYTDTTDARWYSRIDSRPDSVVGCYKYNPVDDYKGIVEVDLHVGSYKKPGTADDSTRLIGKAAFKTPSDTVAVWTRFAVPFTYYKTQTPRFYLFILNSGDGVAAKEGSEIWFDDIAFVYKNSPLSIPSFHKGELKVYTSFGDIIIQVKNEKKTDYNIMVTDILGRQLYNGKLLSGDNLRVSPGRTGIYIVKLYDKQDTYTRKVLIR